MIKAGKKRRKRKFIIGGGKGAASPRISKVERSCGGKGGRAPEKLKHFWRKKELIHIKRTKQTKIFEKMDKMMKAMTKSVEEMVSLLGDKYGFDKAEALEFIMPGGEITRGRPSKPKKKVVNKTEMVEDVIKTIMEGAPQEAEAVPAQAEPVIVAAVVEAPKEKKKAAPKKKKAEATVVEAVALVAPDTVAALIAVESTNEAQAEPVIVASESGVTAYTVEEGEKTAKAVAALMEATKEDAKQKKKAAPKKKKAEAEAVVAQAEPVTVAAEGGVKGDAPLKKKAAPKKKKAEAAVVEVAAVAAVSEPVIVAVAAATEEKASVEAAPIKKKAAPKKKADAPVVEVATVAAVVAVAAVPEEKADAPEGGLNGDAPLKKKAAPKKKADAPVAARKVAAGKPDAVVEAPKAVVEAPKPAPKAVVEELSEEEVEEEEEEVNVVAEVSPVGLKSVAPESDEESTDVKEWTWEVTGETYLKCCDNNCDILNCDCTGVVYSVHTQEPIGRWNGTMIEDNEDEDDE